MTKKKKGLWTYRNGWNKQQNHHNILETLVKESLVVSRDLATR